MGVGAVKSYIAGWGPTGPVCGSSIKGSKAKGVTGSVTPFAVTLRYFDLTQHFTQLRETKVNH